MRQEDLEYLVSNLANLCGIPTRLYLNKKLVLFVSYVKFVIDPFVLYKNEVLPLKNHIGYFTTNDFFYYAYLNSDNFINSPVVLAGILASVYVQIGTVAPSNPEYSS